MNSVTDKLPRKLLREQMSLTSQLGVLTKLCILGQNHTVFSGFQFIS